jgi:hypothetical protein
MFFGILLQTCSLKENQKLLSRRMRRRISLLDSYHQILVTAIFHTTRRQISEDSKIRTRRPVNFKFYIQTRITLLKEKRGMEMVN